MLRRLVFSSVLGLAAAAASAQEPPDPLPDLMIVFDGSGSMWGQVGGEPKIALARRALSQVLSETRPDMRIGMLAYGHRQRGQCGDIELIVPMGPAPETVSRMIAAANAMNPRGMTPLTDAVTRAAESLGFTERAATVVLVTDGIETCGGDPCALGRALAARGVDFRAHVVGFDLSDDEQRQVSCLAEETGGLFLAARDAEDLARALARTLSAEPLPEPEPEPEPEPLAAPRPVELVLRDVAGGPVLTGRPFPLVEFHPLDRAGAPVVPRLGLNPGPLTGTVDLLPGRYRLLALRETPGGDPIRIGLQVDVPDGAGPYRLDLVVAARLRLNVLLAPGQAMPEGYGRLRAMAGQGWAEVAVHPVIGGAIDPAVNHGGINGRDLAVPPGDYFVRATLSQMLTREWLVHVPPGGTLAADLDMAAAPVTIDLRDAQGFPLDRVTVGVFDIDGQEPFVRGYSRDRDGLLPVYLPPGLWRVVADTRPAAEAWLRVDAAGVPVTVTLRPGDTPDPELLPDTAAAQCAAIHPAQGCVIAPVTPETVAAQAGLQAAPPARFTGTWQTRDGMMALVQDGRRVWGEIHVNGGIGIVWGHVGPDGLSLRGAMDRSSNPRGVMELRLADDGGSLVGVWDHAIGRMGSAVAARRLSAGVPPLAVATGTEADLRTGRNGQPWAPADSPEFEAFMAPALAPASPDTGEDIDAMQAAAAPLGFTGVWATNHQLVTMHQDGRIVRGGRPAGSLVGHVSADGRTLRGVWDNGGQTGLFEFRLDAGSMGFTGGWGMAADTDLRGGAWTGTRRGWLAAPGASGPDHPVLADPDLAGWFAPVRDPVPAPDP